MNYAYDLFRKAFNWKVNFMTPNIVERNIVCRGDDKKTYYYEISWGRGIMTDRLYGVTIISEDDNSNIVKEHDLSKAFDNHDQASKYVLGLKKMLKDENKLKAGVV